MIDLLKYCVYSGRMDLVFLSLVREFRTRPTAAKAVTLYELFCAEGAPARLSAGAALPPRNLHIRQAIERLRENLRRAKERDRDKHRFAAPATTPPAFLFDFIVEQIENDREGPLAQVSRDYDPQRTPVENLPEGQMSPGQRQFVANVWNRRVRLHLASAGFRSIATVS
jgi:hypothetical protein